MSLDPEIKAMLCHVIHVAPALAVTSHGDKQYGTPEPQRVHVQRRNSLVHTADGTELLSDIQIIGSVPIGLQDLVWLPNVSPMDERDARRPKAVAPISDEDGSVSHYEVSL